MVLVDGGSYLVGAICAAGVDLPALKPRAVQVRHVFGLRRQPQVDEMQARHEAEAEALLNSYTIHSSRTEHGESAEPQTGGVEVVVAAMREHGGSVDDQLQGCVAL